MSAVNQFSTGPAPLIRIAQVDGDLMVQAWPQPTVQATCSEGDAFSCEQAGDAMVLRCHDDLLLRVPADATLHLEAVHGDARVTGLAGALHLVQVDGDVQIRGAGDTRVGQVHGDLVIRQVAGELTVDAVHGDADIAGVTGHALISRVTDDLALSAIGGSVEATAGDDLSLRLLPKPEQRYVLQAGGDIVCRLPAESDVAVSLRAGDAIRVRKLPAPVQEATGELDFVLGSGQAQLTLTAGDSIVVTNLIADWDDAAAFGAEIGQQAADLAEQVGRQIEVQLEGAARQLEAKLAQLDSDEIGAKVQVKVQAALRKAEEAIAAAVRNAEQRPAAGRRRSTPPPPKPAKPSVSGEERMTILRMVDAGKLSVEQAEQLLAALGGKRE